MVAPTGMVKTASAPTDKSADNVHGRAMHAPTLNGENRLRTYEHIGG